MIGVGWAVMPAHIALNPNISLSEKAVLLALTSRAGAKKEAWPSHRTLAAETGLSVSGVKLALDRLREHGLVSWTRRVREDGGKASNLYTVHLDIVVEMDAADDPPLTESDPEPRPVRTHSHDLAMNNNHSEEELLTLNLETGPLRARERTSRPTNRVDETSPAYRDHLWSMR